MSKYIIALLIVVFAFSAETVIAQDISASKISKIDVDSMSDEQIASYWQKAQDRGYSMEDLETIALSRGLPATEVAKLKKRIRGLKNSSVEVAQDSTMVKTPSDFENQDSFGMSELDRLELFEEEVEEEKKIFGFDFFKNPNISFAPNLNLATPVTYQLGPGDEVLIDVWGASQNNYQKTVGTDGAIRIENVGPVYVSGLLVNTAKKKIISYLKKIYSGIDSKDANNKVHADVSIVGVRTVQVNIIGDVEAPGTYSLSALSTVLNALYAAGGPSENGTFRNIKLVRNGKLFSEFDVYKFLIEGVEKGNTLLRDQDIIIVNPYISRIEVDGNVKKPGIFELKEGETIEDLKKYFGGFTANAYKERLIVERVDGKQKQVKEIELNINSTYSLQDGDVITVGEVIDRYENRIVIEGAVYRPGEYELTSGLTLSQLIQKADGVTEDVFLDRGMIYRNVDEVSKKIVPFSIANIVEKTTDIALQREDSVVVFSVQDLREERIVSVDGAVNTPQEIEFYEEMTVEDLIAVAGGFKDGADVSVIDVSRRVADGDFKTMSKNIKLSSSGNLQVEGDDSFFLEPFDRVSVRYIKGYTKQKNVMVEGEVKYPGNYVITNKDERISDLLEKSGGITPYAYVKGATLIRKITDVAELEQLKLLDNIVAKDSLSVEVDEKSEFNIGINLEKILKKNISSSEKSKYDLIIKQGDRLIIPTEKQTVEVRGEVLLPSLIRYDNSKSLRDYINNSGGFKDGAKRSNTYVLYANGDAKSTKRFLFFKNYPKIEPGAIIFVPPKEKNKKATIQEVVALTSAIATLALLIKSF